MDSDRRKEQLLIQEQETHVENSIDAEKRVLEANIDVSTSRFVMISIFGFVAFTINSAERVKLWFRDEVSIIIKMTISEFQCIHFLSIL